MVGVVQVGDQTDGETTNVEEEPEERVEMKVEGKIEEVEDGIEDNLGIGLFATEEELVTNGRSSCCEPNEFEVETSWISVLESISLSRLSFCFCLLSEGEGFNFREFLACIGVCVSSSFSF